LTIINELWMNSLSIISMLLQLLSFSISINFSLKVSKSSLFPIAYCKLPIIWVNSNVTVNKNIQWFLLWIDYIKTIEGSNVT
jgi:hypothetical protein